MGKSLSEVDRAYLAGLLDGDGAIMALIEKHPGKRFGFRVRIEISATQSFRDHVAWIPEVTGIGYIRRNGRTFQWIVRDQQAAFWFLDSIEPFTRTKGMQIALAKSILSLPIRSKEDLVEAARLADSLSKFNVRSQQRRKNHATMVEENGSRND